MRLAWPYMETVYHVSLDKVIKTMRDGGDMKTKYKETPAAVSQSTSLSAEDVDLSQSTCWEKQR